MSFTLELEFIDSNQKLLTSDIFHLKDQYPPVPNEGERVFIDGIYFRVKSRDFIYSSPRKDKLKITFWCKEISDSPIRVLKPK